MPVPLSWKMPQPAGGSGWLVSSPAMNRPEPSGKKQIWALMSRPSGSSAAVVMTRWASLGSPSL